LVINSSDQARCWAGEIALDVSDQVEIVSNAHMAWPIISSASGPNFRIGAAWREVSGLAFELSIIIANLSKPC
jgi:hypothetical protein